MGRQPIASVLPDTFYRLSAAFHSFRESFFANPNIRKILKTHMHLDVFSQLRSVIPFFPAMPIVHRVSKNTYGKRHAVSRMCFEEVYKNEEVIVTERVTYSSKLHGYIIHLHTFYGSYPPKDLSVQKSGKSQNTASPSGSSL